MQATTEPDHTTGILRRFFMNALEDRARLREQELSTQLRGARRLVAFAREGADHRCAIHLQSLGGLACQW